MTTISLATELERIYREPVYVQEFRTISVEPSSITLEVSLVIEGENPSKTFVEITK